MMVSNL